MSKGFPVALHMGTDIMRLCLMPGSGKGYDLTPGLWWNSAIRHTSLDQGAAAPGTSVHDAGSVWGGCGFRESQQSADVYKLMAVEPCASRGTPALSLMRSYILWDLAALEADGHRKNPKDSYWDASRDSSRRRYIKGFIFARWGLKHPSVFALQTLPGLLQSVPFSCPRVFEMIVKKGPSGNFRCLHCLRRMTLAAFSLKHSVYTVVFFVWLTVIPDFHNTLTAPNTKSVPHALLSRTRRRSYVKKNLYLVGHIGKTVTGCDLTASRSDGDLLQSEDVAVLSNITEKRFLFVMVWVTRKHLKYCLRSRQVFSFFPFELRFHTALCANVSHSCGILWSPMCLQHSSLFIVRNMFQVRWTILNFVADIRQTLLCHRKLASTN